MTTNSTPARYGLVSIGMHWLMLILLIGVFGGVEFHEMFPRGSDMRTLMMKTHFSLGMLVFLLVWLRIAVRAFSSPAPEIKPALPDWHSLFSKAMHLVLYAIMIGLPLLGWLMMNANGRPVPFFGMELPVLLPTDKELAHSLKEVHETVGNLLYILIGLHAVAALFHHYVLRNNTLRRMLPFAAA